MWGRIWTLCLKEIIAVWYDKRSRYVLIGPPLVQLFIFAWAATLDVTNVPVGILNRDNGAQGFELVQRFYGSPVFNKIVHLQSVEEIAPAIDTQKVLMVLHLDEQFSRNLEAKKPAEVQLILDGRKSNTTQILYGYAVSILNRFNQDFGARVGLKPQKVELVPRNWFNPNLEYYWYNVPCLCGVLSMLIGLTVTALSIARERELGTFDQLLVSPLKPIEILIGKALPAIFISMIEGTVIILAAIYIFRVPFTGSLLLLYLGLLVFVTSIVGAGLFISSLCTTQQQAILGSFIFMVPNVSLSGFATPIENMPLFVQKFTLILPLRYFLVIAKGSFLKGLPAHLVWVNVWPLALIACATLSAATWLFRSRLE